MADNFKQKSRMIFWIVAIIFAVLVLWANIQYVHVVQRFFDDGHFTFLNRLTQTHTDMSLDFYTGQVYDLWVGPLSNLVLILVFTAYCFLYIEKSSVKIFALSVFCFLVISKFNILGYPPYGDAVGGPFAEGLWLAKHNFNYAQLYRQPGYDAGGPKVYFFSIYPTCLALLYKIIPSTKLFLAVNHLLVFLMAAIVMTLTRTIMLKHYSYPIANLTAIFLLSTALFQAQTEAINMEMPCLFFSMFCACALIEKKIGAAFLWAVLAALVKGQGIVMFLAVAFISVFLFAFDPVFTGLFFTKDIKEASIRPFFSKRKGSIDCHSVLSGRKVNKKRWKLLLYAVSALVSGVLIVCSKYLLNDQHVSGGLIAPFSGWASLKDMPLTYLYLVSLMICVSAVSIITFRKKQAEMVTGKYYPKLVIFVVAGAWFILFLNFLAVSPRYMLELTPFLILCVMYAILTVPQLKKAAAFLLVLLIMIASVGSYGIFHRKLKANYHVLAERSLEYRNDLKLYMRLARLMETEYKNATIGAPFIMAQILSFPELGYVKRPVNVLAYGMPLRYGDIKNFEGLKKVDIMKTVWIGLACQFDSRGPFTYPVNYKYDRIIEELKVGRNWAVLFIGGVAVEERKQIAETWLKFQIERGNLKK